jgi:hypothetical protein
VRAQKEVPAATASNSLERFRASARNFFISDSSLFPRTSITTFSGRKQYAYRSNWCAPHASRNAASVCRTVSLCPREIPDAAGVIVMRYRWRPR